MKWITNLWKRIFNKPKPVVNVPQEKEPVQEIPSSQVLRPSDLPASNHYASKQPGLLAKEYEYLWSLAKIQDEWVWQVNRACRTILQNKPRYLQVEKLTSVPWYVVAVIHCRESNFSFKGCMHNGDPLPGPTTRVPKGRGPFESWEDSCVDAFKIDNLSGNRNWSLGNVFYRLEAYNGFGYRTGFGRHTIPNNSSPYIYSGTQFYTSGKYTFDGVFDSRRKDEQLGAMAILKRLEEMGEFKF